MPLPRLPRFQFAPWLACVVAALALSQRGHAETTKVEAKQSADTKPNAVPKPHGVEPVSVTPVVTKASANGAPIAAEARELIVVRSANWQSSTGTLTRFERDAGSAPWHAVGEAVAINLGRHGMAWGRGLHSSPANGPVKRERDGKSPAGVFALSYAFGAAPELPDGSKPFPYLQVKKGVACVEETRSKFYNRIVDASADKSWERRSEMLRKDGLFRWGVVVEQNAPDTVAGSGSCVFLHIWRGPKQPTSGCTSLAPDRLEEILRWLQADKHPLLVQLPDPVYEELHESWKLPD